MICPKCKKESENNKCDYCDYDFNDLLPIEERKLIALKNIDRNTNSIKSMLTYFTILSILAIVSNVIVASGIAEKIMMNFK